jgi:hypothetical protein
VGDAGPAPGGCCAAGDSERGKIDGRAPVSVAVALTPGTTKGKRSQASSCASFRFCSRSVILRLISAF